jgi:hypothetical protein
MLPTISTYDENSESDGEDVQERILLQSSVRTEVKHNRC